MHDKLIERPRCDSGEDCPSGSRNRYFLSKRLTPDAFRSEQDYHVGRRRLLNRSVFGWGVVYGFAVGKPTAKDCAPIEGLEIGPGFALDRAGRELLLPQARTLVHSQVWVFDPAAKATPASTPSGCGEGEKPQAAPATKGEAPRRDCDAPGDQGERCWLLSAHYAERWTGPVTVKDDCHCERHEWDRLCEEVLFSLRAVNCASCCPGHDCELCCGCVGDCEMPLAPRNRGPHGCLCHHLTHLEVEPEIDTLCKIRDGLYADLHNGVPLACVTLKKDECDQWQLDRVLDACGPRRLVKRNDLLFDLVRGCDLTVIDHISWHEWHRSSSPVAYERFAEWFCREPEPAKRCVTEFSLRFSRPVQRETLRADCFTMTAIAPEEDTGWGEVVRVPIVDVETTALSTDPPGHVRDAKLVVDGDWVRDELRSNRSIFRNENSQVEIEVRGDFILDCNGQPVDADAVGLRAAPTGNGTPGGTFVSVFTVGPAGEHRKSR